MFITLIGFVMNKKLLTVFFSCVIFSACDNTPKLESVYTFGEREEANVSEIVKDFTIVPLELTDENQIMDASEVRIAKDKIFVLDCYSPTNKTLHVFDMEGNYMGHVGTAGQGPGEYIMPMYFMINETGNLIYIRDMATNKLLAYNIETYDFVKEIPLEFYSTCCELYGENQFIWYINAGLRNEGDLKKHIQITDADCHVQKSLMEPYDFPKRGLYNVMNCFMEIDGETYFHHPFLGEYNVVKNDSIASAFSLQFDHHSFPTAEYLTANKDAIIDKLKEDGYIQWCDAFLTDNTMACYFGIDKTQYWGIYDRKQAKGWYIDRSKIKDDLGIGELSRPKAIYDNRFVNVVYTENLEELPENSILFQKGKEKISGNPVILIFKP